MTGPTSALPTTPPLWVLVRDLPHWLSHMFGLEGEAPRRYVIFELRREAQHFLRLQGRPATAPAYFWEMLPADAQNWDTGQVFLQFRHDAPPVPLLIEVLWGAVVDAVARWQKQQARKAALATQATTKTTEPEPEPEPTSAAEPSEPGELTDATNAPPVPAKKVKPKKKPAGGGQYNELFEPTKTHAKQVLGEKRFKREGDFRTHLREWVAEQDGKQPSDKTIDRWAAEFWPKRHQKKWLFPA